MREFIQLQWGDVVGIFLISLGVFTFALIEKSLGQTLIGAGLLALKLKNNGRPTNIV